MPEDREELRASVLGDTLDFGIDSAQNLVRFVQHLSNKGVKVSNETVNALNNLVDELQEAKSELI